jgi:hypothetical protein
MEDTCEYIEVSSTGETTKAGPLAWGLNIGLTAPYSICDDPHHRFLDLGRARWWRTLVNMKISLGALYNTGNFLTK